MNEFTRKVAIDVHTDTNYNPISVESSLLVSNSFAFVRRLDGVSDRTNVISIDRVSLDKTHKSHKKIISMNVSRTVLVCGRGLGSRQLIFNFVSVSKNSCFVPASLVKI